MKNKIRLIKKRLRNGRLTDELTIKTVAWQSIDYLTAIELRNSNLNRPSGLALITAAPVQEELAIHLVATIEDKVVGTLFIEKTERENVGQIKQVAVSSEFRGRQIGQHLMAYAEKLASQQGYHEIVLNARESAWTFYEKLNYTSFGEQTFNGANLMQFYHKELPISSEEIDVA